MVLTRILHTWLEPLINPGALGRWKDPLRRRELFQQFVTGRGKPLKRLRACFKNGFQEALASRFSIRRIMQIRIIASL